MRKNIKLYCSQRKSENYWIIWRFFVFNIWPTTLVVRIVITAKVLKILFIFVGTTITHYKLKCSLRYYNTSLILAMYYYKSYNIFFQYNARVIIVVCAWFNHYNSSLRDNQLSLVSSLQKTKQTGCKHLPVTFKNTDWKRIK